LQAETSFSAEQILQTSFQRDHVVFTTRALRPAGSSPEQPGPMTREPTPRSKLVTQKKNGSWHILPAIYYFSFSHILQGKHLR